MEYSQEHMRINLKEKNVEKLERKRKQTQSKTKMTKRIKDMKV